jgi:hypothetical protein
VLLTTGDTFKATSGHQVHMKRTNVDGGGGPPAKRQGLVRWVSCSCAVLSPCCAQGLLPGPGWAHPAPACTAHKYGLSRPCRVGIACLADRHGHLPRPVPVRSQPQHHETACTVPRLVIDSTLSHQYKPPRPLSLAPSAPTLPAPTPPALPTMPHPRAARAPSRRPRAVPA